MSDSCPSPVPGENPIVAEWDRQFAEKGDAHFFGTEPSDMARAALAIWVERNGERRGRAVDLGCGEGRDSVWLARHGFDVLAVDGSEVGLRKAQRLAQEEGVHITFVRADIRQVDFGAPDLLYSHACLHCLGQDCLPFLFRVRDAAPPGAMHAIRAFNRLCDTFAGREDLYRFDLHELRYHYRDWKLLLYSEEILWRQARERYMSFSTLIAEKPGAA